MGCGSGVISITVSEGVGRSGDWEGMSGSCKSETVKTLDEEILRFVFVPLLGRVGGKRIFAHVESDKTPSLKRGFLPRTHEGQGSFLPHSLHSSDAFWFDDGVVVELGVVEAD